MASAQCDVMAKLAAYNPAQLTKLKALAATGKVLTLDFESTSRNIVVHNERNVDVKVEKIEATYEYLKNTDDENAEGLYSQLDFLCMSPIDLPEVIKAAFGHENYELPGDELTTPLLLLYLKGTIGSFSPEDLKFLGNPVLWYFVCAAVQSLTSATKGDDDDTASTQSEKFLKALTFPNSTSSGRLSGVSKSSVTTCEDVKKCEISLKEKKLIADVREKNPHYRALCAAIENLPEMATLGKYRQDAVGKTITDAQHAIRKAQIAVNQSADFVVGWSLTPTQVVGWLTSYQWAPEFAERIYTIASYLEYIFQNPAGNMMIPDFQEHFIGTALHANQLIQQIPIPGWKVEHYNTVLGKFTFNGHAAVALSNGKFAVVGQVSAATRPQGPPEVLTASAHGVTHAYATAAYPVQSAPKAEPTDMTEVLKRIDKMEKNNTSSNKELKEKIQAVGEKTEYRLEAIDKTVTETANASKTNSRKIGNIEATLKKRD